MATYTDNFNLKLPAGNEQVSRQDLNANFQALDDNAAVKENAVFTGHFTVGARLPNYDVGNDSVVMGERCAAGYHGYAFGYEAISSGPQAFALGNGTRASGSFAFAINGSAWAKGRYSFAAGDQTDANGACCFSFGHQNTLQPYTDYPDWVAGNHYYPYDIVHQYSSASDEHRTWMCMEENSDSYIDNSKWLLDGKRFIEMVGNGIGYPVAYHRSNARALDWRGNEYLNGTLICECNADSSGGKKLIFNQDGTVTWEAVT